MIHQIYIISIVVITILVFIYYYIKSTEFDKELEKIKHLEYIELQKTRELEKFRKETVPCSVGDFKDPRSCYFGSNYMCSWNTKTKRCDMK